MDLTVQGIRGIDGVWFNGQNLGSKEVAAGSTTSLVSLVVTIADSSWNVGGTVAVSSQYIDSTAYLSVSSSDGTLTSDDTWQ